MIIGIGGYATSGKDAVAGFLQYQHKFYRTYMSKPLEQALLTLDPFVMIAGEDSDISWKMGHEPVVRYSELHTAVGYDESKKIEDVRRLLQKLGTEVGRNMFGENVWLDLLTKEIECVVDKKDVVVTGMRFSNELDFLRKLADEHDTLFQSWWIDRGLDPVNDHASDNSLSEFDFDIIVPNHGTLDDLREEVTYTLDGE